MYRFADYSVYVIVHSMLLPLSTLCFRLWHAKLFYSVLSQVLLRSSLRFALLHVLVHAVL